MKIAKVAVLLATLGVCLVGCSSPDANGVEVSRPSIFNYLQSPPASVPASPLAPVAAPATPQVPGTEYAGARIY
jgi:hypothetical protein